MSTRLSVNVNAVAQLRNRRNLPWPSVTGIARLVLETGADGITVHPRPDERHIRRTDVFELQTLLRRDFPQAEYNIEGYPSAEFLDLVEKAMPDQVTFVPDTPEQATSDHGWEVAGSRDVLIPAIGRMKALGIRVSLFIDEDPAVPAAAKDIGADRIEIYTAPYGGAFEEPGRSIHLENIRKTAAAAHALGLGVNAGHDLTLQNLPALKSAVPQLMEVSIGHAITADALLMGFPEAVRRYQAALAV
ncbi:MAG: pyridoxine 5'-phosphate synthase [Shinella sp.]|nr:pyridoxine 5'-phosphate synthase [Shinella sp.]